MWPGQPSESKKLPIISSLLYHNLRNIHTNTIKSLSVLQNLMGFFLKLQKWDTTFRAKDISKNITWCNVHSHGWFLQARSHINTSFDRQIMLICVLESFKVHRRLKQRLLGNSMSFLHHYKPGYFTTANNAISAHSRLAVPYWLLWYIAKCLYFLVYCF